MSFVIAGQEAMVSAAGMLGDIGSAIGRAHATAAAHTTAVEAAAADEVSTAIAALLGSHGNAYQAIGAQAAAFHEQFVQALSLGAGAYAAAEAANASPLDTIVQELLDLINAPTEALLGRPLIGDGANGGTVNGVGQPGGA